MKNKKILKLIKKINNKIKIINKFGIILRTICSNKNIDKDSIIKEIFFLKKKWILIKEKFIYCEKIKRIYSEKRILFSFLRDNLDNNYKYIICNNYNIYLKLISYIFFLDKNKVNIIKYYSNKKNIINIFDRYKINKQIEKFLGKYITLYDGSYLIIENTETLHVFDINSNMKNINNNINSALKVNLIAIREIVRQIRLRNIGGIIIIDCIDMNKKKHKKIIYKYINKIMNNDKCKHEILTLSKFNILQITRHRKRQELEINNKIYINKNKFNFFKRKKKKFLKNNINNVFYKKNRKYF
ncbi:MAG: ribonuclease E/G [Candidatus Shikimatogenerans bostrichidophilus]|nr:MAG: ribonuclease E/G [Candidatus Shikimatogenerans bostrichidophilus]